MGSPRWDRNNSQPTKPYYYSFKILRRFWLALGREQSYFSVKPQLIPRNEGGSPREVENCPFSSLLHNLSSFFPLICIIFLQSPRRVALRKKERPLKGLKMVTWSTLLFDSALTLPICIHTVRGRAGQRPDHSLIPPSGVTEKDKNGSLYIGM